MKKIRFDASQHMRYWIKTYSNIDIDYPKAEIRKYIVDVLDGIFSIIALEQENLKYLDELIKSRFIGREVAICY